MRGCCKYDEKCLLQWLDFPEVTGLDLTQMVFESVFQQDACNPLHLWLLRMSEEYGTESQEQIFSALTVFLTTFDGFFDLLFECKQGIRVG